MSTIDNPTIVTKEAAAAFLDANPKPVIFWDTCSLLDIIRLPIPKREQPISKLENIMAISHKITNGDIISLASVLTVGEFNHHVGHIQNEVIIAARAISKSYNKYMEFVRKANPAITSPAVDLTTYNLEQLLNGIVQDIAVQTQFIDQDNTFSQTAEHRVIHKIPPARKKGEYKDCYIWSTCMTVRQLSQKANMPFGFLSSNINDYAKAPTQSFDPDVAAEATPLGIVYYADLHIAHGQLKGQGVI
jgi:hypothetical protein